MPSQLDLTVTRERIASIDLLRGLVMIVMALDHVRDFFSVTPFAPEDVSQTTAAYFFTRWITHFCAPVFLFLSGASAWLYRSNRDASNGELSRFLLTRGLWLVFLELTVIGFFWQFWYQVAFLQVIWAIGWSMMALGLLVYLPRSVILAIGLAMIVLHNGLLDGVQPEQFGGFHWVWRLLHVQSFIQYQDTQILQGVVVAYPVIPWIGVMAVGYCLGPLLERPADERDRMLFVIGSAAIAAFLILRGFNIYGEPGLAPADKVWQDHDRGSWFAVMSFLNTTKYPPSLLFLCMTLGPAIALLPVLERWRGKLADIVTVYGRVPFLFYILHLLLIHLASKLWVRWEYGTWLMHPFVPQSWPADYSASLLRCYLVWVVVIVVLYLPCKRFVDYRRTHRQWWLSYV